MVVIKGRDMLRGTGLLAVPVLLGDVRLPLPSLADGMRLTLSDPCLLLSIRV